MSSASKYIQQQLGVINPHSAEFIPNSASIIAEETEIIKGAKLTLTLVKPNSGIFLTSDQTHCDTTHGTVADSSETIYHIHCIDGTCFSTGFCYSDGTIKQLHPELESFVNIEKWATSALLSYGNDSPFTIQTDSQLKISYRKAIQSARYKQIIDTTLHAKELMCGGILEEEVNHFIDDNLSPSALEFDTIKEILRLDDTMFFGYEDDESPEWMTSAEILATQHTVSYPGCLTRALVKNTLFDKIDIAIAKDAVAVALALCFKADD
jgi:hypothetical protein